MRTTPSLLRALIASAIKLVQGVHAATMKSISNSRNLDTRNLIPGLLSRLVQVAALVAVLQIIGSGQFLFAVEGKPFPAPNLSHCNNSETCCTPTFRSGPTKKFKFQSELPMRVRPAAHLVDAAYVAKIQKAYALMRSLPNEDGRSLLNQAYIHCVYCDNHLYFPGHEYPLEIHNSWHFFPWHRLFLYFHERILAKLLEDDTFALPYWNWDNQSQDPPLANLVPEIYAANKSINDNSNWNLGENNLSLTNLNSLYDPDRNKCSLRPHMVDFHTEGSNSESVCPNKTAEFQRTENAHLIYNQMVSTPVTASLFFGQPYRFGDFGGVGGGTLELSPHGPIHRWTNIKEMGSFKTSAKDPIFYAHHANVDRLWTLWYDLPGGHRKDLTDPDWLETEFTFYDENGDTVSASIAQSLEIGKLRYKFDKAPTPWVTGALEENATATWKACSNATTPAAVISLIKSTKPFRAPVNFTSGPTTFLVKRQPASTRAKLRGEEILEIRGKMDHTKTSTWHVFLYFPEAVWDTTEACPEFLGVMQSVSHVGMSTQIPPKMLFQVGIGQKLRDMGRDNLTSIVVTLVGPDDPSQTIVLTSAKIVYSNS